MLAASMLSLLFNLLMLFAAGVILVFVGAVCLDFSMKRTNRAQREEALKQHTAEPSDSDY